MVQRSPSPAHVRDKRWVRGLVVAVIVTAIAVKMEMYVRSTTDWTVVQQDSIFWQAMDGLFMKADAVQVIVLAGAKEFGETTGRYFHMHKEKPQRADATDTDLGKALWTRVEQEIAARRAAPSA
ncbi:hypothetical protein PTSG_04224 [Salpingoeca rosetta]|uniref:Uncharacterized protein n=1 Tax=Salpingoeca rosetta (strain ATCC 50818 / BSB-021) TaxID=946362 RepID=F2U6Y4_SALR5|nr:uncharacterized protein PTSG_04224 [Salpingoeca rosetta]EGD83616.1 hypothetical protein PTSG_04224 [Salpingoeca rosetta]|eukprot:XP_004995120.1 hypothetical protein PTSG_04224 [Salpingoeca rosetta]